MIRSKRFVLAAGLASVLMLCTAARADGFSFGFSWGDGSRCYRPYAATYVYRDYTPVYYDCGPVVVYDAPVYYYRPAPVVYTYPRYYAAARCYPAYRPYPVTRTYYYSSSKYVCEPRPTAHRVHVRWR